MVKLVHYNNAASNCAESANQRIVHPEKILFDGVDDNFTFQVFVDRRNYPGCLDLIMGREMAWRGEQDYR